jgi:hypothetical protein
MVKGTAAVVHLRRAVASRSLHMVGACCRAGTCGLGASISRHLFRAALAMQFSQENVMDSYLRSRKLIYRCTVPGEELTEEQFCTLFERAVSTWKRRIGETGEAKWVGRGAEGGSDGRRMMRSGAVPTFKEFEVYVLLPCAVRPRVRGSAFQVQAYGWNVSETVRGQRTTSAAFFEKPLKEWDQGPSGSRILGPGLGPRPVKPSAAVFSKVLGEGTGGSANEEQVETCGDTIHVQVRRTPSPNRSGPRLWSEDELVALISRIVEDGRRRTARPLLDTKRVKKR